MYILFYFINKNNNNRRDKIQAAFEKKDAEEKEVEYYRLLREIAVNSRVKLNFNYEATISQLKEKCNPKYFINKNNFTKLEIATEIYSELLSLKEPLDKRQIRILRKRANEQLGIMLSSEETYKVLDNIFDPTKFVDENFEANKLLACTKAHEYILKNRSDLRKLEQFAYKINLLKL